MLGTLQAGTARAEPLPGAAAVRGQSDRRGGGCAQEVRGELLLIMLLYSLLVEQLLCPCAQASVG